MSPRAAQAIVQPIEALQTTADLMQKLDAARLQATLRLILLGLVAQEEMRKHSARYNEHGGVELKFELFLFQTL